MWKDDLENARKKIQMLLKENTTNSYHSYKINIYHLQVKKVRLKSDLNEKCLNELSVVLEYDRAFGQFSAPQFLCLYFSNPKATHDHEIRIGNSASVLAVTLI